ncbi:RNA polymerase sigma factor [Rhodohalobacter sp. 614A]|uniref:RNA polymerase sigma factor n=1 Tax=Rhodohalobacter sp. 614A TaxID=2908649 RepID=UPI001F2D28D6|nr:sigma-70 family RNA polymerase sigma factor [Rhodohalobacter sp. 614A]
MFTVPTIEALILFILLSLDKWDSKKDLYKAIKDGDEKAFKVFFEEHYDSIFVFLRSRNVRRDVAEDLIQKAFIYIWKNRHKIKPELSLKAYLFRIAYTRMLNHIEQEHHFLELEKYTNGNSRTPQDLVEFKELNKAFRRAVSRMPEKRRIVFESCFLQDLTYRETAENLSVSIKTVENHMALAFKDLRKTLEVFKEN